MTTNTLQTLRWFSLAQQTSRFHPKIHYSDFSEKQHQKCHITTVFIFGEINIPVPYSTKLLTYLVASVQEAGLAYLTLKKWHTPALTHPRGRFSHYTKQPGGFLAPSRSDRPISAQSSNPLNKYEPVLAAALTLIICQLSTPLNPLGRPGIQHFQ